MYPVKTCRPLGIWSWGSARVKAYVVAIDPNEVSAHVLKSAREALAGAADQPTLNNEVGFIIVHRCSTQHLLLACTWREGNELWETVWEDTSGTFVLLDRPSTHLPTYCVWEMGVVAHETRAWRRVLNDGVHDGSLDVYINDSLLGEV